MTEILRHFNFLDMFLIAVFLLPLAAGAIIFFSRERIRYSLGRLLNNIVFVAGIVLSVYVTKRIFFIHDSSIFNKIYDYLPEGITEFFYGRDILAYVAATPFILMIFMSFIRIIMIPLDRYIILPLSDSLYSAIRMMGPVVQRLAGALWQLPKALGILLVTVLVLNFSTYYLYVPDLAGQISSSTVYNAIYGRILVPVLNSNIAKQIPVIVNDSFRKTTGNISPGLADSAAQKLEELTDGRIKVIEYFNGVTLEEAIKSSNEIDAAAREIVGEEKDETKKAYLIYKWISRNVEYDYEKAARISQSSEGIESGSLTAFTARKGICFDFSCLYVSMCRAVGLRVRLVTGLGYSGTAWGDHAWNQVYNSKEYRWMDVDPTFGASGINYFDKRDFDVDHRDAEVQGEW